MYTVVNYTDMRVPKVCLLFVLLSITTHLRAQQSTESSEIYLLSEWNGQVRICEIQGAKLLKTITVTANGDTVKQFIPFTCQTPSLTDTVYTISLTVRNDLETDEVIYFYSGFNDFVQVHILNEGILEQKLKVGYRVPVNEATFEAHYFYTAFTLPSKAERELVVTIKNRAKKKAELQVALHSETSFYKTIHAFRDTHTTSILLATFFHGALGFMVLFMAFLYFKNKQVIYLYYSFYLAFCVLYVMLNMPRLTLIGQWVDYWPWLRIYAIEPVQFFSFAAYNLFALELLQIKKANETLYKIIWVMTVSYLVYIPAILIVQLVEAPAAIALPLFIGSRAIIFPVNLIVIIQVIRKVHSPIVKYFISGLSAFLLGGIVASYCYYDPTILQQFFPALKPSNIYQAGILLEVLCFSFALGYRIKLAEDERSKNHQAYVQQVEANRQMAENYSHKLEEEVLQRSEKIISITQEAEKEKAAAQRSELERKLVEAEMMALRSQMNPHFLFNSLNSIKYFIMSNQNDKASGYLSRFSKLIRQILDHSRHNLISLEAELAALQLYLEIEANRFEGKFQFLINVSDEVNASSILIPPMLLQPFVENAIWHGLLNSESDEKKLSISVFDDEDTEDYVFIIEDNGIGRKHAKAIKATRVNTHKSVGMALTESRIELFNKNLNNDIRLEVQDLYEQDKAVGTRVIIRLKVKQEVRSI
jgi:sensor histidine kinase YesM